MEASLYEQLYVHEQIVKDVLDDLPHLVETRMWAFLRGMVSFLCPGITRVLQQLFLRLIWAINRFYNVADPTPCTEASTEACKVDPTKTAQRRITILLF